MNLLLFALGKPLVVLLGGAFFWKGSVTHERVLEVEQHDLGAREAQKLNIEQAREGVPAPPAELPHEHKNNADKPDE